jgi:hypothetical protein
MSPGRASSSPAVPSPRTPPGTDADAFRLLPDAACGNDVRGRRGEDVGASSGTLVAWLGLDAATAIATGAVVFGAVDWWSAQLGLSRAVLGIAAVGSLPYAIVLSGLAARATRRTGMLALAIASKIAVACVASLGVAAGPGPTHVGLAALALFTAFAFGAGCAEWLCAVRAGADAEA